MPDKKHRPGLQAAARGSLSLLSPLGAALCVNWGVWLPAFGNAERGAEVVSLVSSSASCAAERMVRSVERR